LVANDDVAQEPEEFARDEAAHDDKRGGQQRPHCSFDWDNI
jgi:hypothetical protein